MSDEPVGQVPASADEESQDGLEALTEEVLPALIARLRASRLGELEVRSDRWRVRLRRAPEAAAPRPSLAAADPDGDDLPAELVRGVARSPAVGYFDPVPDLAVGASVLAGDLLGTIDVLGIVQDVNAPCDGIISAVLIEDGQAVEYGQALAEIDPLEIETESETTGTDSAAGVTE